MKIALIYARSNNYCIGKDGDLPWHLPDEFAFFETTTTGHPVIMGRRTFEDHESALANRINIVVSRTRSSYAEGVLVAADLDEAYELAAQHDDVAFVIGGADLLAAAFEHALLVYETVVDVEIAGDTFVPAFDFSAWETESLLRHAPDDRHAYGFETFIHRKRIQRAKVSA